MRRLILLTVVLLGLASCFKETSYSTTYIIQPSAQLDSADGSDAYVALEGVQAFAFAGSWEDWQVMSYDDALAGIITSVESGEQKGPFAWSDSYEGSASDLALQLDRTNVIIVAVDPESQIYAYTDYTVPINLSQVYVDILFRMWREESYTASTWTFFVPEVEDEEVDEEVDETETEV